MIGRTISHYEITEKLGEGGMGVVYKAIDKRLGRSVAIKVVNAEFTQRFEREAKAISALNHPHICTLYDVGEHEGAPYLVMEYVEGQPLKGPLPVGDALRYAIQTAQALVAAHKAGIIHRDLKPDNILLTGEGSVKVLDFGLAKLRPSVATDTSMLTTMTEQGVVTGTAPYMSPEQAKGEPVDARSDIFSFGAVLYELLSGRRAFRGETMGGAVAAVITSEPPPLREAPPEVARIVGRMLAKKREDRYQSAEELLADMEAAVQPGARSVSWRLWFALAVVLALSLAGVYWVVERNADVRRARPTALPQVLQAVQRGDYFAAFAQAHQAERYISDDPILKGLWPQFSRVVTIETDPAGASVYRKEYRAVDGAWEYLGRSPLRGLRIPHGYSRWKIEAAGYQTLEAAGDPTEASLPPQPPETVHLALTRSGDQFEDMALVPAGATRLQIPGLEGYPPIDLPDYWIDRYEVSNRDFKRFIGAGGYQKEEYWKQPFTRDGRALTFQQAMSYLRDRTGRPGPAGWELSDYPSGQDDYPVVGVSWYRSAAYAEFLHKSLPTAYHWSRAASPGLSGWIVPLSNFGGSGLLPRQASRAVSRWGVYDMAGNAKEWCWNVSGTGRLILGGGYNEPPYMFNDWDAKPQFDRAANFGFRLMLPAPNTLVPDAASAPVPTAVRDYRKEKPVSDAVFAIFKSLYAYDAVPLNASATTVQETSDWRVERVSYHAGYGDERLVAFVATPKHRSPPYQTVVNFPGAETLHLRAAFTAESSVEFRRLQYVLKSGRALVLPILKGTYDRGDNLAGDHPNTSALYRDHVIMWSKELRRTVDYIDTRRDLDATRIAYYGFSWGGALGAMLPALEPRVKRSAERRGESGG